MKGGRGEEKGLRQPGSGCRLRLGDVLDQIRAKPRLLLDLGRHLLWVDAGCGHGADLVKGGVVHGEVLIEVLSVAPDISLQELNALHIKEDLYGIGHGLAVGWRYLDHSEPWTSLHQVEEVHVGCTEGQMNQLLVWVQVKYLIF